MLLIIFSVSLHAQIDDTFTYQGSLIDNGSPAQGVYDITISAYDNASGAGLALAASEHLGVVVDAGLFTIEQVDLGSNIYDGLDLWLQISVRQQGAPAYTDLSPLQQMHSVPYANSLIDKGAQAGQVLTFNAISGWQPATPDIGTDDQNITGSALNGTELTIGIEGGNGQVVDLAGLQDGTGTDDQNITGSTLNGTELTIGIEGGNSQVVDLSGLQDGTGTDDQNISGSALNGTELTIGIESGNSETVDLAPLQDGPGTRLIRVADSAVLGKVIGFNNNNWTIINNNGYLVHVDADGVPELDYALYNDGACAGTPLYLGFARNANATGSTLAAQGYVFTIEGVGTYYVAQGTNLIDNATYDRRRNSPTNCQSWSHATNTVMDILVNSEAVTGVPDGGYGAVRVE